MRINKKLVIKSGIYAAVFVFFTVLETNILNGFRIFGAKPNLIILLVAAAAVSETEKYAAIFGMVCGFLTDSSVGSPFFFSGLYYFFAAYLTAALTKYRFGKSFATMCLMSLPVCALRQVFNVFYLVGAWGNFDLGRALLEFILPEYIYTVALAPAVYLLVKLTAARVSYNSVI
ncbi:MAG: rod shape-determining protein MreD [Oscillospiraceae bacterium]|nr:rod shape-determining protein MreD [Oscillospiraceae bacterium]